MCRYNARFAAELAVEGATEAVASIASTVNMLAASSAANSSKPIEPGRKVAMQPHGHTVPEMQQIGLIVIHELYVLVTLSLLSLFRWKSEARFDSRYRGGV
jgi:hypothetical protein